MKVRLRELKPNPVRDFNVDPLDEEIIERLRASIREHGFWGGVVGRQRNGHIEIGAGHHRIEAAIREGVEEGEVHVLPEIDNRRMTRLYAEENATQRGAAHSTARAGSVAAALREVAYETFKGVQNQTPLPTGDQALAQGIGWRQVYEYLEGVPGIKEATVKGDLSSLKKCGEYARIIGGVRDQIAAERQQAEAEVEEARRAAEEAQTREQEEAADREAREKEAAAKRAREAEARAAKVADKADQQEQVFDFKGTATYLKTAHHLESFRDVVTSEAVLPYLPMDQQAVVAERLVQLAKETGQELTGLFIRSNIIETVMQIRENGRKLDAAEREHLQRTDWAHRVWDLQHHYFGALRSVEYYGSRLLRLLEEAPEGAVRPLRETHDETREKAVRIIEQLKEGLK